MFRKHVTVALFAITVMAFSCADKITKNIDENYESTNNARVIGTVHGILTDANTNARISGATVVTVVNGTVTTTSTDSLGYYVITGMSSGTYEITFTYGSQYAVSRASVIIPRLKDLTNDQEPGEEDYTYNTQCDIDVYTLDGGLTGTVYKEVNAENTVLAAGVTVVADFAALDISPDEYTAVTDANGAFSFSNLPAGRATVRTLPHNDGSMDFAASSQTATLIPGTSQQATTMTLQEAEETPFVVQNNIDLDDVGLTDDLVLTFSKAMETATFDVTLTNSGSQNVEFDVSWDGTELTIDPYAALQAGETYTLTLTGNSTDYQAYGKTFVFSTIDAIEFVYTNVERYDGSFDEFAVSSNITLEFSKDVDINASLVTLNDADGNAVEISTSLSSDSRTITIDPVYSLDEGADYTVVYTVCSGDDGDMVSSTITFSTATSVTAPGQVSGFNLNMGDSWHADWNTTSISFEWNTVAAADSYFIYAKDSNNNPNYIVVKKVVASDYLSKQSTTVNLAGYPQFDYYDDDGIQTPFTAGITVSFKIAAVNGAGTGEALTPLDIEDETAPAGSGTPTQSDTVNNTGTGSRTVTLAFRTTEYLRTTSSPSVNINDGGGAYVLPTSAVSFDGWDADKKGGSFTLTIPAGSDPSGDQFIISGFYDNSENANTNSITYVLQ